MTQAEETAKFIPTGKNIVHRGRTYDIYNPPADEHRAESPWILKSAKGKWYALVRNKPNPKMMFGLGLYDSLKCLPGWFTDKNRDGTDCELRSVG